MPDAADASAPDADRRDTVVPHEASTSRDDSGDDVNAASSCTGTVTLRTQGAVSAGVDSAAKAKASVLTLATGSFTVPGGKVKTVTLHLSPKGRALLARSHVLRVRATIVARDPMGETHTGQTIATLHAASTKHGKD